ncbi:ABC transporter substrate-binding protein [Scytonema sp. NUACC26]|uniref:ABC transporter substrate-binding protein n=1 Tax=Scytonema sp. NUACC26 TaxID=3140176 RepID=UPI0034DCB0BD
MRRMQQLALVGLLIFWILLACSHPIQQQFKSRERNYSIAPNIVTRKVKHALGETVIPTYSQRVVILHPYLWEDAIALGVKPIGAPIRHSVSLVPHIFNPEVYKGTTDVGFLPTNLEKVLALKPDLILGLDVIQKDIYPLLSQIAPTVMVHYKGEGEWKSYFMQVAEVLGKVESARLVLSNYYSRLQKFKTTIGARLAQIRLSVVGFEKGVCWLYAKQKDSFSYGILSEASLIHTPSQNQNTKTVQHSIFPLKNYLISWEYIDKIDGDIIFVTTFAWRTQEQYQKELKRTHATPLWFKLKAVQQGKVYQVGSYWFGASPLAANLVIDDLFKYLLKNPQSL